MRTSGGTGRAGKEGGSGWDCAGLQPGPASLATWVWIQTARGGELPRRAGPVPGTATMSSHLTPTASLELGAAVPDL